MDADAVPRSPSGRRRGSGRRRLVAALAVAVLAVGLCWVATAALTVLLAPTRGGGSTRSSVPAAGGVATGTVAPLPTPDPHYLAQAQQVLDRRAAAVLAHDAAGWTALLDPADADFRRGQTELFARLSLLPLTTWRYDLLGASDPAEPLLNATGHNEVSLSVRLHLRLGPDSRDVLRDQSVRLRLDGDGSMRVAGITAAPGQPVDLWDVAPITVARGTRSLVVAAGSGTDRSAAADAVRTTADAAAAAVDAVWGRAWPRVVVVLAPATADQAGAVVGSAGGLHQLAASTTGSVGAGDGLGKPPSGTADRVVLNPEVYDRLTITGRQVVLRHELTHVATRSASALTPPLWLQEGFAAYLGYLGSGIAASTIAADALHIGTPVTAVTLATPVTPVTRVIPVMPTLPPDAAFDASSGAVAAAYASAWVACEVIASRAGTNGLVAFYRTAAGIDRPDPGHTAADALSEAFTRVLGENEQTFRGQWQDRLGALARSSPTASALPAPLPAPFPVPAPSPSP